MYSIPSYCEFGNRSTSVNFLQGVLSSMDTTNVSNSMTSSKPTAEAKAIAACKSHSEAERRRRKRINGHLATLRTLLPSTIKTDKASLLAEVVRRVRELKKATAELAEKDSVQFSHSSSSNEFSFPSETDELKLCYCEGEYSDTIKATVCCDDRPELISDVRRAVRSVEGKVVKAEMATVGGRMKSVLWIKVSSAAVSSSSSSGEEGLGLLRRALKVVMDRAGLSPESGQGLPGNKRPRLSHY
ncbi:transcription factor bHLH30-like [Cornus florida]|uniref:transcription factor bHLH30-like n=1 Tax=Cornus florida TaxID=4283 RepID=UPI0028A1B9D8|nr:transcription factor bHLH30-like [Cornus florida]